MSRKALFPNLGSPPNKDNKSKAAIPLESSPEALNVSAPNNPRLRMRPILGSPDLIPDDVATPVGAIGQSLSELTAKTQRADEIERKLSEGAAVVELDTATIDPSFITDRMPSTPDAHATLVQSIREHGQHVPILVRPHPDIPGRYQVAYGHRRLRALAEIGRPVKAVVRALGDDELVIAQGQENSQRKDLSYIEKARFAHRLEGRFRRETIMSAMSLYKSDLSNMVSVVERIPEDIVDAIGAAPAIGRRGWIELAEFLAKTSIAETVRETAISSELQALNSDERFRRVLASTKPRKSRTKTEIWSGSEGKTLAKVISANDKVSLTIDRREAPEFADFVLGRLQELFRDFQTEK
jgi:ParB family chromosome partitioning protein